MTESRRGTRVRAACRVPRGRRVRVRVRVAALALALLFGSFDAGAQQDFSTMTIETLPFGSRLAMLRGPAAFSGSRQHGVGSLSSTIGSPLSHGRSAPRSQRSRTRRSARSSLPIDMAIPRTRTTDRPRPRQIRDEDLPRSGSAFASWRPRAQSRDTPLDTRSCSQIISRSIHPISPPIPWYGSAASHRRHS